MLLGSPSAGGHTLRDLAERAGANREEAVTMAARGIGLPSANVWREKLAQRSDTRRLAVIAAGAIGDPSCVPWLIEQMSTPDLARSAFAAFTLLTGVNLEQSPVTGKGRTCNLGVTDDVASEDLPRDPDEGLPWPDPVRVEEWWHVHRSRFRSGHRYLAGISISRGSLASVLRHGLQPQRAAAAIELALERPGEPLFEVRAPGFRQLAAFGAR
jgi:uncharacterized protein (TIGR02270 family)